MKNIILLLVFLTSFTFSTEYNNTGYELYVFGISYHSNRDYPFKEFNPGIGINKYYESDDTKYIEMTTQASLYRNSFGNLTGVATFGPRFVFGHKNDMYAFLSFNGGIMYSENYKCMTVLPVASIGYKQYFMNLMYMPKISNRSQDDTIIDDSNVESAVLGIFLGYRF